MGLRSKKETSKENIKNPNTNPMSDKITQLQPLRCIYLDFNFFSMAVTSDLIPLMHTKDLDFHSIHRIFLLFSVVTFYRVGVNTELEDTESLPLGRARGEGSNEPQVTVLPIL